MVVLKLISVWPEWVKRRTETIDFVGDSAVRRSVAVDFRLKRSLLREPFVAWGDQGMHYIPLAFLDKLPLAAFSLHDEDGRTIPLLTRHKNAGISAATLSAFAQSSFAKRLRAAALRNPGSLPPGFDTMKARDLRLPASVEAKFLRLTMLRYFDRGGRRAGTEEQPDAESVFASFAGFDADPEAEISAPEQWSWELVVPDSGPVWWEPTVSDASVEAMLVGNADFRSLADAFARTFLLCVPVPHRPGDRRVLKYSYHEPIREPVMTAWHRTKTSHGLRAGFGRLRKFEDRLEGLPMTADPFEEWAAVGEERSREMIRVETKLLRAAGWRSKLMTFSAPAVDWGSSYHLEIAAPEGTQVRRAGLNVQGPQTALPVQRAVRGARNLERAHLYLGEPAPGRGGTAEVALKPRSSTIVRSACVTALLVVGALALTLINLEQIQEGGGLEVAGALLLLVPGILAVYTARGGEHPMTTSMLYGLRLIAGSSGVWAVCGAGLLLLGPASGARLVLWFVVLALAVLTTCVLAIAWRLAARGRPLEQALASELGGA